MAVAVVRILPAGALEPAVDGVNRGRRVCHDKPSDPRAVATDVRAAIRAGGNARPRFSARRRIPAQALALKKYRCGTSPVSKTSDNEHTLPSLGDGTPVAVHSHKLSVKNPVGEPIPDVPQEPEEGTKVPSSV